MGYLVAVRQHPLGGLLQGSPRVPQVRCLVHQQAIARGGAQGIDDLDLPLRILLPQRLGGDVGVVHRAGLTGGEGNVQQVALLQLLLEKLHIGSHVDLGGLGELPLL